MRPLIKSLETELSLEQVLRRLPTNALPVLLKSGGPVGARSRYSLLAAFPMLQFVSRGADCRWLDAEGEEIARQFGNPWQLLEAEFARFELPDEPDTPFPTGGCFGYWGYDLKQFVEPRVGRTTINDLDLDDCRVGFYPSLIVRDHLLGKSWLVATGLKRSGVRDFETATRQVARWRQVLESTVSPTEPEPPALPLDRRPVQSTLTETQWTAALKRVLEYIRLGHIYQVNLSRRWTVPARVDPVQLFEQWSEISPAPYSGFMDWHGGALISSSPEQFLKLSGNQIVTRPIKGTRARGTNPDEDARLSFELQSSEKERAELVMITDLLRNDIGRICEFGSVKVPELMRLERFAHVQHLVSTVEGRLRSDCSHLAAMAACFPGGSITGAPKIRAMQIIEELEPVSRGPYTGAMGYIGFNRESQLNILIRTAIVQNDRIHYHAGSGIVADSDPVAEFEETEVKACGFFQALEMLAPRRTHGDPSASKRPSP